MNFIENFVKHRITDRNILSTILNTMYAIFLALFVSYLIKIEKFCENTYIYFLINEENFTLVSLFFLYFLFDWFTANLTMIFRHGVNHLVLILGVFAIGSLGGMMVASLVPNFFLLAVFSLYAVLVPIWDFSIHFTNFGRQLVFYILASFRFCIALYMCIIIIKTILWRDVNLIDEIISEITIWIVLYVFLKIIRYVYLTIETQDHGGA